jgi:hypothetical protein
MSVHAFAVPGGASPSTACAAPGRVCLRKPMLQLYIPVYKSFVLHLEVSACQQKPVLHLYVCFCAEPGGSLSSRAYFAPVRVLLCFSWMCLYTIMYGTLEIYF